MVSFLTFILFVVIVFRITMKSSTKQSQNRPRPMQQPQNPAGKQSQPMMQQPVKQSIVERAKQNTAKYQADATKQQMEREHRHLESVKTTGVKEFAAAQKEAHPHDAAHVAKELAKQDGTLLGTVEDLMVNCETTFTYHTKEELLEEADRLLNDKNYYDERCNETDNLLWSPSEFAKCVEEALYNHSSSTKPVEMNIDFVAFSDIYLRQSNYFKHCLNLFFTRNKKIVFVFMNRFICGCVPLLKRKLVHWIYKFLKKFKHIFS